MFGCGWLGLTAIADLFSWTRRRTDDGHIERTTHTRKIQLLISVGVGSGRRGPFLGPVVGAGRFWMLLDVILSRVGQFGLDSYLSWCGAGRCWSVLDAFGRYFES